MDCILYFSTFSIYNVQMRESFFNVWIKYILSPIFAITVAFTSLYY